MPRRLPGQSLGPAQQLPGCGHWQIMRRTLWRAVLDDTSRLNSLPLKKARPVQRHGGPRCLSPDIPNTISMSLAYVLRIRSQVPQNRSWKNGYRGMCAHQPGYMRWANTLIARHVLSTRDCLVRRLAGQVVDEAHVVREGAVGGGERADGGREVGVEGAPLVAEDRGREERGGPGLSTASSARLHQCSTGNSQCPAVSNPASDSTWASGRRRCGSAQFAGDPVGRAERGLPPVEQRRERPLPLPVTQLRDVRPAQRHAPAGLQPVRRAWRQPGRGRAGGRRCR